MQQPEADSGAESRPGPVLRLMGSVRALIATFLAIGRTRLELLSVEVQLELRRAAEGLVLVIAGLFAAGIGLFMAGMSVVFVFWDSHRVLAAVLVALGFLGLGAAAVLVAVRRLRAAPGFLEGTLAELVRDIEQLRGER
jgi:uncharacterized membrane protein YqjE